MTLGSAVFKDILMKDLSLGVGMHMLKTCHSEYGYIRKFINIYNPIKVQQIDTSLLGNYKEPSFDT